jgi:16S rRNA processing protein RimM
MTDILIPSSPVVIGKIGAPHGLKGWNKIFSYTRPLDDIFHYPTYFLSLENKNDWKGGFQIPHYQSHGKDYIAQIQGSDNRDTAQRYCNYLIAIEQHQLPKLPDNHYYWRDLEGMQVINQEGKSLGIVDHLIEVGNQDTLVVHGDKIRVIPFMFNQFIESVNDISRTIVVNWDADF